MVRRGFEAIAHLLCDLSLLHVLSQSHREAQRVRLEGDTVATRQSARHPRKRRRDSSLCSRARERSV